MRKPTWLSARRNRCRRSSTKEKSRPAARQRFAKPALALWVAAGMELSVNSAEDFKRALLAAKTIVYADPARGGVAGIHVAKVIEQLGMAEHIRPKLRLAAGGDITEVTLSSAAHPALHRSARSPISPRQWRLAGPLPEELQSYTVFVAGVPANVPQSEGATALLKFLRSPKRSP